MQHATTHPARKTVTVSNETLSVLIEGFFLSFWAFRFAQFASPLLRRINLFHSLGVGIWYLLIRLASVDIECNTYLTTQRRFFRVKSVINQIFERCGSAHRVQAAKRKNEIASDDKNWTVDSHKRVKVSRVYVWGFRKVKRSERKEWKEMCIARQGVCKGNAHIV